LKAGASHPISVSSGEFGRRRVAQARSEGRPEAKNVTKLFDEGSDLAHMSAWLGEDWLITTSHGCVHRVPHHNQLMGASKGRRFVGSARESIKP
jgi:hypothetical protein